MATDRLKIYNGALLICGDRDLASLSENAESRRLLDLVWNDGGVKHCLEQAQWHFAMRSSRFDYETSITPEFGFARAFTKPPDWVNTSGVWGDASMHSPLLDYADEAGYWFANQDELYVKYVSNHASYGGDFSKWPESFTLYVKTYFASRVARKLPGGKDRVDDLCKKNGELDKALLNAKNRAAMALPATFPSRGTWVAARHAGAGRLRRDGGSTSQLIG